MNFKNLPHFFVLGMAFLVISSAPASALTCVIDSPTASVQAVICRPTTTSVTPTFAFSGASYDAKGLKVNQIYIDGIKHGDYFVKDVEVTMNLPIGSHRMTFQTVDKAGNVAAKSEYLSVHNQRVYLSWKASTTAGVDSYIIYRSLRSGGGYSKIGTASTLTFTDKPGLGTFYYVVTAVSPKGETGASNEVKAILR